METSQKDYNARSPLPAMATTERRGLRGRGRSPAAGPATAARPAAKRGAWKGRWPRRRREADEAETTAAEAGRRADRAAAAGARTGASAAMETASVVLLGGLCRELSCFAPRLLAYAARLLRGGRLPVLCARRAAANDAGDASG